MEIKEFIMVNGDKIIGRFVDNDDCDANRVCISDPILLKEVLTEKGIQIIPMPYVQTSDKFVVFNGDSMSVKPFSPVKELVDLYMQMTSNLVLSTNQNSGLKLVK